MPLFNYICRDCNSRFQLLKGVTAEEAEDKCPECGSSNIKRLMSNFSISGGSAGDSGDSCPTCPTGSCPL